MARSSPQSHAKRARELALREKRERKAEKKAERRAEAEAGEPVEGEVDPELELEPGENDDEVEEASDAEE